ncbi:hypothetical protein BB561_001748 [Smittium simulii]|uniref:Uncharacterized protein n=1 Tax=Smittium simulii TaxID=133385 RepID=A0A2T9YT90_9FUNG|nr:hypothetical protein BB561_001748 [Smittium simulii]
MDSQNEGTWYDYTQLLFQATNDLPPDQLINLPNYEYADVMFALVIMDPVMDSGHILPKNQQVVANTNKPLAIETGIWIVDRLFCLEMLYYSATSIAQTLYTCVYYHIPPTIRCEEFNILNQRISSPIFDEHFFKYAFVLPIIIATAKCAALIDVELVKRNVYVGEDFNSDKYDETFWEEVSSESAILILKTSINIFTDNQEKIVELILYSRQQTSDTLCNNISNSSSDFPISDPHILIEAALNRLKMRLHWLQTLCFIDLDSLYLNRARILNSQLEINQVQLCFNTIKKFNMCDLSNVDHHAESFFNKNIASTLSIHIPVKRLEAPPMIISIDRFEKFLSELSTIDNLFNANSIEQILWFSQCFAQQKLTAFAFTRSIFQSILFNSNTFLLKYSTNCFAECFISNSVGVAAFTLVENYHNRVEGKSDSNSSQGCDFNTINQNIKDFVYRFKLVLINIFKSYYQNQSQQRRIQLNLLCYVDSLQNSAKQLDYDITCYIKPGGYLQHFYDKKLIFAPNVTLYTDLLSCTIFKLIESTTLSGFSQNLYESYEHPLIYWHLHENYISHKRLLEKVLSFADIMNKHMELDKATNNSFELRRNSSFFNSISDTGFTFVSNIDKVAISSFYYDIIPAMELLSLSHYLFFKILKEIGLLVAPWDSYLIKNLGEILNIVTIGYLGGSEKNLDLEHTNESKFSHTLLQSNICNSIINRSKQTSIESKITQYNLRFRHFLSTNNRESYSFKKWANSDENVFDSMTILAAFESIQCNLNDAYERFENIKKSTVEQKKTLTTESYLQHVDSLSKLCLENKHSAENFIKSIKFDQPSPDIFNLTFRKIKQSFEILYSSFLNLKNKKSGSEFSVPDSKNIADEHNNEIALKELIEYYSTNTTQNISETQSIESNSTIQHYNTFEINNDKTNGIYFATKVISSLNENIIKKYVYSLSFEHNNMWSCINLTNKNPQ